MVLKIKSHNEFIEVHKNEKGIFLLFGAETEKQRKFYEMNLTEQECKELSEALVGSKSITIKSEDLMFPVGSKK